MSRPPSGCTVRPLVKSRTHWEIEKFEGEKYYFPVGNSMVLTRVSSKGHLCPERWQTQGLSFSRTTWDYSIYIKMSIMSVFCFSFLLFACPLCPTFPIFLSLFSIFPLTEEQGDWNDNHSFHIPLSNLRSFSFCFALQCKSFLTFWAKAKQWWTYLWTFTSHTRCSSVHPKNCLF